MIEWRPLPCARCFTLLLKDERPSWCCKNQTMTLQKLPPYPPDFQALLQRNSGEFSRLSRALNYLFAFSSIGISGSFVKLPTPSNVAVTGRVYHKMHDINAGQHSLRWFLYDQQERANRAAGYSVPEYIVDAMRLLLDTSNP